MPRTPWLLVTGRAGVLLGIAGLCSLGCLSAPGGAPGPDGGKKDDVQTLGVPEAYFTLDGTDLRSAGWPGDYEQYSVFVCTPSLSAADVAQIHGDIPGATVLGYTNVADMWLGQYAGNPYHEALEAAFDSTLCVMDLWTDTVVRQGNQGIGGAGLPHFVMRQESADVLVAFHRDVTMQAGWDGLYVDQCTAHYPPWRALSLTEDTPVFDASGDGLMDDIAGVEAQYETWRPYYTQRLRQALGNAVVIVANSGGALADPAMNGITLEGVGTRFTIEQGRAALLGQRDVSRMPFVAALWITTEESRAPSLALAQEIDGVRYGTVEYFP